MANPDGKNGQGFGGWGLDPDEPHQGEDMQHGRSARNTIGPATRGFDGLVRHLVKPGKDGMPSLTNVCQVAGLGGNLRKDGSYRDGSYAYYVSEPVVADDYKGVGPFIYAALELGR